MALSRNKRAEDDKQHFVYEKANWTNATNRKSGDKVKDISKEFAIPKADFFLAGYFLFNLKLRCLTDQDFAACLSKTVPRAGRIYLFENYLCFKSSLLSIRTKVIPDVTFYGY